MHADVKPYFYSKRVEEVTGLRFGEQFTASLAAIAGVCVLRRRWRQAHWVSVYSRSMQLSEQ